MNTSIKLTIGLLFGFIAVCSSEAQQKKRIEIQQAGAIIKDEDKYPGAQVILRNDEGQVHITHESIAMWCDKAVQYKNDNFIEAYGNVKMVESDSITMNAKYVEYSGKSQLAFASGDVVLTTPDSELKTEKLYYDRIKQQAYYITGGTVVKDTSGTITSKIGRYYMNLKKYKFIDSVVMVNKESTIKTNFFDYYEDTKQAYLYGPSTITTPESKTYCEKGFYDTELKTGYAVKKAKIYYDNRIVEGDSLFFDNNTSFASATNHIKVTDTINKSIVTGHYAEVFKAKDSVFITKRALVSTLQEKDSIYIHADTLMVTGKPEKRITRAFKNVKLYKSNMSSKADSIHVNHATGLTQMINISKGSNADPFAVKQKPILWNIKNQITGDTIHLKSNPETEKIDSLIVFDNAFVISKDTLDAGYNQINGKKLIGLFDDNNELYHVDIIKNAQSIYYMRNEKNELVGIDKSKSGSIQIFITDREIDEVRKLNQIDGKIHPESEFPDKEKLLKGFDWRDEERPLSVEDLFKDDPPLVLPKIKGLEDYVPQEDFFDEGMLERIETADEESNPNSKEEGRASRNLPQRVKDKTKPEDHKKVPK